MKKTRRSGSRSRERGNSSPRLQKTVKRFLVVGALTFGLAIAISLASAFFLHELPYIWLGLTLLMVIILINIVFDTIGLASAAGSEPPFHAMAADRIDGASEAAYLIRNADRVTTICNDMISDVCGTLSGAVGATIALRIMFFYPFWNEILVTVVMTSLIASLTVGGKAAGKVVAIAEANKIMFAAGKVLARSNSWLGWPQVNPRQKQAGRKGSASRK